MPLSLTQIAVILAGVLWPFVFQFAKTYPGWQDKWANAVAILFCYVLAGGIDLGSAALGGTTVTLALVAAHGSAIVALSQLVYRQVIASSPTPEPPKA